MWPFNYRKVTERLNTVDLGDDLDDVELLMAVEEIFQINLEDSEAEDLVSVGELYELVKSKMPRDGSVDPLWELIVLIVRSHSGSNSPIDTETTFFPKFAKPRQK
ncbi:acyl carrier protein [uncultured Roseobacter sp.]|uniref:acyl carrier protein n=1 Tax=uncultured Roseobacter sp. TaxID=114847 RepID=UPI0026217746|nr:acyl carrier protein [uncultured Roseobacter sp.]